MRDRADLGGRRRRADGSVRRRRARRCRRCRGCRPGQTRSPARSSSDSVRRAASSTTPPCSVRSDHWAPPSSLGGRTRSRRRRRSGGSDRRLRAGDAGGGRRQHREPLGGRHRWAGRRGQHLGLPDGQGRGGGVDGGAGARAGVRWHPCQRHRPRRDADELRPGDPGRRSRGGGPRPVRRHGRQPAAARAARGLPRPPGVRPGRRLLVADGPPAQRSLGPSRRPACPSAELEHSSLLQLRRIDGERFREHPDGW